MLWRLIISACLALPLLLDAVDLELGALEGPLTALWLLIVGYHRSLLDRDAQLPLLRVVTPTEPQMRARYTLWGVPLAPPRRVRISPTLRARVDRAPWRNALIEALPSGFRWLARQAGA
ncbi:MAG: hypothetical protein H6700_03515 [Myxococcales bacterium]|nr:hypothetical protein [Myxococcales bacterium]MCB9519461.1 hypothetical protein [Myxococcales bacterium]MCB9530809.1 hypothetical protein [Myxococcales bacterium]